MTRLLTKFKRAGDITVDYAVPTIKALVSVVPQGDLGESGTCNLLVQAANIDRNMISDYARAEKTYPVLADLEPVEHTIKFPDGMLVRYDKLSKDGGLTWINPRDPLGVWLVGMRWAYGGASELEYFLFESRAGETIDYIEDHATLETKAGVAHPMGTTLSYQKIYDYRTRIQAAVSETSMVILLPGENKYYVANAITANNTIFNTGGPANWYAWDSAGFITIGGVGNNNTASISTFYCDGNAVQRQNWTNVSDPSPSGSMIANTSNCDYVGDIGPLHLLCASSGSSRLWYLTFSTIYSISDTSNLAGIEITSPTFESGEYVKTTEFDGSNYLIYSNKAKYESASILTPSWTKTVSPAGVTESDEVLYTKTYGTSDDEYQREVQLAEINYLGNGPAKYKLHQASDGKYYEGCSEMMADTYKIHKIKAVKQSEIAPPFEVTLYLGQGDELIAVADCKLNLTITGVES